MKRYNIIWADDKVKKLLTKETIENLGDDNIYVIEKVKDGDNLEKVLKLRQESYFIDKVDAVIVDANFRHLNKDFDDDTRVTTGLDDAIALRKIYPSIPFILYTGRSKEMLLEKYDEKQLDYFIENNLWFEKNVDGDFKRLRQRIIEIVDSHSSPEFILRDKYTREFEIAKQISGAESTLYKSLLIDMNASNADSVDYYNALRKVIEGMFEKCKEHKIIPPITELSACCTFLEKKHPDYYIAKGEIIMHEALVYALRYALNMTQDGSHSGEKKTLQLKTDEYAREAQSNHLFSSILRITMDLLLWFAETIEKYDDERAALRWEKYDIIAEVTIESVDGYKAHGDGYTITINKKLPLLRKGDVIQIKKANEDKTVNWKDYSLKQS